MILKNALVLICLGVTGAGDKAGPLWANDFEAVEVGAEPEGVIASGDFTVQQNGDNKLLETPGLPIEPRSLHFGPPRVDGVAVAASILAEKKGRQSPSFGVGLGGPSGYRLLVSPMRGSLELARGEEMVKSVKHKWESGAWTRVKLAVVTAGDGKWKVIGKAWPRGQDEPQEWAIELEVQEAPPNGKASLWGMPYSGLPIRYDDVIYEETR